MGLDDLIILSLIFMVTLLEISNPIGQIGNPGVTETNDLPETILCVDGGASFLISLAPKPRPSQACPS